MKKYLIAVGVSVLAMFALLGAFNWLANPYGIYAPPEFKGFNAAFPLRAQFTRISKAAAIRKQQPEVVFFGSSRTEQGLDPAHLAGMGGVYNAGLPGTQIYELYRYYQHALADAHPKTAVIGLDLLMFNGLANQNSAFDENFLAVRADGSRNLLGASSIHTQALFTWAALSDSVRSWSRQDRANRDFLPNGSRAGIHQRNKLRAGVLRAFRKTEARFVSNVWFDSNGRFSFTNGEGVNTLDYLEKIFLLAHQQDVELKVYFSPIHARLLGVMHYAGLSDEFFTLKLQIARINERVASELGRAPFPIHDFAIISDITTEKVPRNRKARMKNYYEASHFTPRVGDIILDSFFKPGSPEPAYFMELDAGEIDAQVERQRAGILGYLEKNDSLSRELEKRAKKKLRRLRR